MRAFTAGFYPVKISSHIGCDIFAALAASLSSAAIHLVASPSEEQKDHAQHGNLSAQAGADGQHRRSTDVVVKLLDRVRCVAMPFVQKGRKPLSKAVVGTIN